MLLNSAYVNLDLNYFKSLKEKLAKRSTIKYLFTTQTVNVSRTLVASHEIYLIIVKCGKNHTMGEDLIKPSTTAFLKTVPEKDDNAVKAIPLSNNTVSKRIDEMSEDIETQLVEKPKSRYLSPQMVESTLRESEVVLLAYARYIDKGEFVEEMAFCKSLETTTSVSDIYGTVKNYLHVNNTPIENITSCAVDGAPVMMGKKKCCLK